MKQPKLSMSSKLSLAPEIKQHQTSMSTKLQEAKSTKPMKQSRITTSLTKVLQNRSVPQIKQHQTTESTKQQQAKPPQRMRQSETTRPTKLLQNRSHLQTQPKTTAINDPPQFKFYPPVPTLNDSIQECLLSTDAWITDREINTVQELLVDQVPA